MINSYDSVSFATFVNCVAVMPEIYTKGYVEKLDKIAEKGEISLKVAVG